MTIIFIWGVEGRSPNGASRGREYLADFERSEEICLVTRDRLPGKQGKNTELGSRNFSVRKNICDHVELNAKRSSFFLNKLWSLVVAVPIILK